MPPAPPADGSLPPPPRWWLCAERGAQQGDPLGPLLRAAAMWLVLERLRVDHPSVVVRAFHDDVVVVGPPAALRGVPDDAARLGGGVDAQLAPAKCVGWSPAGVAAPRGGPALWTTTGSNQFSVPLGGADFVAAAVDGLATAQVALCAAIRELLADQVQVQLLILRLCAGPQANYWLRTLPLADAARLVGAVDRGAQRVLAELLCDARDDAATRAAVVQRAALPPRMGGLGSVGVPRLRRQPRWRPASTRCGRGGRTTPHSARPRTGCCGCLGLGANRRFARSGWPGGRATRRQPLVGRHDARTRCPSHACGGARDPQRRGCGRPRCPWPVAPVVDPALKANGV